MGHGGGGWGEEQSCEPMQAHAGLVPKRVVASWGDVQPFEQRSANRPPKASTRSTLPRRQSQGPAVTEEDRALARKARELEREKEEHEAAFREALHKWESQERCEGRALARRRDVREWSAAGACAPPASAAARCSFPCDVPAGLKAVGIPCPGPNPDRAGNGGGTGRGRSKRSGTRRARVREPSLRTAGPTTTVTSPSGGASSCPTRAFGPCVGLERLC